MFSTIKSYLNIVVSLTCTAYRYSAILILVILSLMQTSCSNSQSQPPVKDSATTIQLPQPGNVSQPERDRILQASQDWYNQMLRSSFNGGMIVAEKGNIIFERYNGTAHIPGKDTINQNTPMHVASISKTFTAMATLKLWQDGKLNIDSEVRTYLPEFNNYPGVTIRTLLNHRSGLPNYLYFMEDLGWDKKKFVTNEDVLNTLITRKSEIKNVSSPNTHFEYCNTNFALLALVIEKVSGKKLPELLKETFFDPLQMKNTFVYTDKDSARTTPSYDWRNKMYEFQFLDKVYGDKNVFTTPRDLLIWDRALCSGKLFKPETLQQAYQPYSNERPGIKNYGLGWHMYVFPGGRKIIYHNGYWHGSNAVFTRLLQDSATIILIGNKFNRNIYRAKDLAAIFGSYADSGDDDESENSKDTSNAAAPADAGYNRDSLINQMMRNKN